LSTEPSAAATPLSDDEIAALRAATPGTATVVHLNHAGASLPSRRTLDVQLGHLGREAEIGGYEAAAESEEADARVYRSIAELIGAQPSEIARLEHATAAWNAAFWSVPMAEGQRILTANAAYGANAIGFLRAVERRGIRIDVVPDDEHGQVDVAELERRIGDDVCLVAITHAPTNGGLVNPAERVGAVTRAAGVPYLLDACQSVGQRVIDVEAIGCDLLSSTGRKYLRGPRGSGFLYASERIIARLTPDHPDHHGADWTALDRYELRPDARRFEHWEYNHAAWLGLGAAVEVARVIGMDRIEATIRDRADRLRTSLVECGFVVHDEGTDRCGIVTVSHPAVASEVLRDRLRHDGINTSCTSIDSTRFDVERRDLPVLLRLSVHCTTTDDELARVTSSVRHDVTRS